MEAVRIALLLVAAALACAAMRAQRPELAAGVALAAGAAALTMLLPGLREAAAALSLFSSASGLDGGAALILRATGISLIAEFAVHISEDYVYTAKDVPGHGVGFEVYIPSRTAVAFKHV